jgi:hypothetical protein
LWLGTTLGYTSNEDWYRVTTKDLINNGGSRLLHKERSVHKILKNIFPQFSWLPWKFQVLPMGFWKDPKQVQSYVDYLKEQLNIQVENALICCLCVKNMEDWYKVTNSEFEAKGGEKFLEHFRGSLFQALTSLYPDYEWKFWCFNVINKLRIFNEIS